MSKLDAKYAKARDALARAEQRLVRAQNAWQRAREEERRLGRLLDKEPSPGPNTIGGKYDFRHGISPLAGPPPYDYAQIEVVQGAK